MTTSPTGSGRLFLTLAGLALLAALLLAWNWAVQLPVGQWWQAAFAPDLNKAGQLAFHFSALPRAATALLAGAALGAAGLLLQQALRNPLASPTTLGLEAGAQLAITLALVMAPAWLAAGPEWIALAGSLAALALVMLCASRTNFASISLVLAGLVAGLFCGALAVALRLLNQEYVSALFLWGSGSLAMQDWAIPLIMLPRCALFLVLALIILRPLELLSLDDDNARALGLPVGLIRGMAVFLSALLTATVTASVGVIGFIGLAAPQIAQASGARRLLVQLISTCLIGALLVLSVDAAVGLLVSGNLLNIPTGAATALFGAPLLIWLLPRLRRERLAEIELPRTRQSSEKPRLIPALAIMLVIAVPLALLIGRDGGTWIGAGWHLTMPDDFSMLAPWRAPRTLVAMLAGGMLAIAGLLLQRTTGNPLAAPEVLGIGTGTAFGLVVSLMLFSFPGYGIQMTAGALGGFATLVIIWFIGRSSGFATNQILLCGIALSALLDAFVMAFQALGDPRATLVLSWISGSTYAADWTSVFFATGFAVLLIPVAFLLIRWLEIMPLGEPAAVALGLPLPKVRMATMGVAALLTAAAMMTTGPLTFVGLAGPHIARLIGARRTRTQIIAAALIGGLVMVVADMLARTMIAPRQIPTGIVAALIGLPYLAWHLGKKQ